MTNLIIFMAPRHAGLSGILLSVALHLLLG